MVGISSGYRHELNCGRHPCACTDRDDESNRHWAQAVSALEVDAPWSSEHTSFLSRLLLLPIWDVQKVVCVFQVAAVTEFLLLEGRVQECTFSLVFLSVLYGPERCTQQETSPLSVSLCPLKH